MSRRLLLANTTVAAGNTVTNTTSLTKFADTAIIIDPNFDQLCRNGRLWTVKAYGYLSSAASTPGTLALKLIYSNVGSDTVLGTATWTLPTSLSNAGFMLDAYALICAVGQQTQTKLAAQGFALLDNAGTPVSAGMVNAGTGSAGQIQPTNGSTSTQNITLALGAQFSVASASNSVTLSQLIIEAAN